MNNNFLIHGYAVETLRQLHSHDMSALDLKPCTTLGYIHEQQTETNIAAPWASNMPGILTVRTKHVAPTGALAFVHLVKCHHPRVRGKDLL